MIRKVIVFLLSAIIVYIGLFAAIPDPGNYTLSDRDKLHITGIDKTGINSLEFNTIYDMNGNILLRKSGTDIELMPEAEPGIIWSSLELDSAVTLSQISDIIYSVYKKNILIDTVLVSITEFSPSCNILITFGNSSSVPVKFKWGMDFRYYLSNTEGNIINAGYDNLFLKRTGSEDYVETEFDSIAMPGDEIFVLPQFISVLGHVNNPGTFSYNPRFTIKDYISMSGGSKDSGDINKLRIITKDGSRKTRDQALSPGDIIIVDRSSWTIFKEIVTALSTVAGIFAIYSVFAP